MVQAGRQPLAAGTYGRISLKRTTPDGERPEAWRAEARFCDHDGVVRKVKRTGKSRTGAEAALKKALLERQTPGASTVNLTANSHLREAAEHWFEQRAAEVEGGDRAPSTLAAYRSVYRNHIEKQLGEVRLRELTVVRCEAWQTATRRSQGPARTKTARTVLGGILGFAARMGAIPVNPTRDLSRIPGAKRKAPRAMTRPELNAWLSAMEDDEKASRWDLPDLTRFLLGTGCRIGEALAVSWDDVDLDAGVVYVRWRMVRVSGEGLLRVPGTKVGDGRTLRVPRWCVDMLLRRRVESMGEAPVFPDSLLGWRDPSNTLKVLRQVRDGAGFDWVTSHVFRKTCLTLLDEAKLTPRQVADVAGHADPSMTQRVYMGRGVASEEAAAALEDLL